MPDGPQPEPGCSLSYRQSRFCPTFPETPGRQRVSNAEQKHRKEGLERVGRAPVIRGRDGAMAHMNCIDTAVETLGTRSGIGRVMQSDAMVHTDRRPLPPSRYRQEMRDITEKSLARGSKRP